MQDSLGVGLLSVLRGEGCIAKGKKKKGCGKVHKVYMHLTLLGVAISQLL